MDNHTIGDFGGPFKDALPVEDPETQVSAVKYNLLLDDVAGLSKTGARAVARFATVTSGDPAVAAAWSVWGMSVAQYPVVTRSGAGVYLVTYSTSFVDELGIINTLAFRDAVASIRGVTAGFARINAVSANTVDVRVFNSSWLASDLSGGALLSVWIV